jgi:hypothetical protein
MHLKLPKRANSAQTRDKSAEVALNDDRTRVQQRLPESFVIKTSVQSTSIGEKENWGDVGGDAFVTFLTE